VSTRDRSPRCQPRLWVLARCRRLADARSSASKPGHIRSGLRVVDGQMRECLLSASSRSRVELYSRASERPPRNMVARPTPAFDRKEIGNTLSPSWRSSVNC
jgi:hypothetical protein